MVSDHFHSKFTISVGCVLLALAMLAAGCSAQNDGTNGSADEKSTTASGKQTLTGSGQTLSGSLQSVSLSVKNELDIDRNAEYVTSGIPIPRSWNVTSTSLLNIVDANGSTVASQFEVTARWGGIPSDVSKPIKWVLATFLADVPASSSGQYALVYGAANDTASSLLTTDSPNTLTIDTGTARFIVNKANFSLFEAVTVDGILTTQSTQNGFALTDTEGTQYTSGNDAPASVTVEETGPVRIVVRVAGSMRSSDASPLTDYTAYLYFYAGKSYARVIHTIGNHNKAAVRESGGYYAFNYYDPNSITFTELSSRIDLHQPSGALSYLIPGSDGNKSGTVADMKVYQDSSGTDYWNRYASADNNPRLNSYVKFRGYKSTNGGAALDSGNQFPGWMDISDGVKGITVGIQGFWQNFPKALSATAVGTVSSNIFPKDFNSTYNFRVGEEKSTEMFFFFHSGTGTEANADRVASGLASPMMALAPPDWYADSGAVQEFTSNPDSIENRFGQWNSTDEFTRYEYYNDRALIADPSYSNIYYYTFHSLWQSTPGHPSSIDYFDMHGWPWHGNQPLEQESFGEGKSGPLNVKYNLDHGAWIHFLRSGDYRWKSLAEASSKHLEALMLHDVITETGWDVYAWKDAVFGHEQHNDPGNINSVRNPLGPVADTAYGGRGAVLHYFLTGYPPSKRFAASAADYAYNWFGARTIAQYPSYAPSREAANVLSYLDEGLRLTGDLKYQRAIHSLLTEFASAKMSWINGPVPGSNVGLPVWIFGDYYTAIARYARLCNEFDLGADCDFAEHELLSYLNWHKTYATRSPKGWTSTYYYFSINGNNDPNDINMVNNWSLLMADALAYGYAFSGNPDYLDLAKQYYRTGTWNPFYLDSPLIYSASKEAVNHMTNGHVSMYYANHAVVDSIRPEISITSPTPNATIALSSPFQVRAFDNFVVSKVNYTLDGVDIGTAFELPFTLPFNSISRPNGTHTLIAQAYDAAGNTRTSSPVSFSIQNVPTGLVWRNSSYGLNTIWKAANYSTVQAVTTVSDTTWKIAGIGDFDGNGRSDLLWRNSGTGFNTVWKAANAATQQAVSTVSDQKWKVAGVGDFNRDGRSDILWRHSGTGSNTIWLSGNAATVQSVTTVADLTWEIVGVGDFNKDGRSDIFWRNSSTGANAVWLSGNSATQLSVAKLSDLGWKVVGAGDFDGDNGSDVLWRNTTTGANVIWRSASSSATQTLTMIVDQTWTVVGVSDVDADGKSDIVWRNIGTGANTVWRSGNAATQQSVATVSDLNWKVVGVGAF